jgi:transcriptional regulator NrdR family protein
MKLEEAKKLCQGEWIAFRTFDESDNPEGEVVLHDKDRRTFDKELLQRGMTEVYITFAGPLVPEGYAVIF